jgi:hypothetical protein
MIVVVGNWHDLEFANHESLTAYSKYESVTRIAKIVLTGLLPLLIYLGLRWSSFINISPEFDRYIQSGLVVWSIVSILSGIDPLTKDKVASVKDILSMTSGSDRK